LKLKFLEILYVLLVDKTFKRKINDTTKYVLWTNLQTVKNS